MMKLVVVELRGRTGAFISLLSLCHPGSATFSDTGFLL